MRTETDSLGPVQVPSDALYGAQTTRAVQNFPVSGLRLPRRVIRALALIKRAAAEVNRDKGALPAPLADAIMRAADEVAAGQHDAHFPVDIFQTGSGTSSHMNANEVIANRAIQILGGQIGTKSPIHPNDHVNMGQSSNDVFPSAVHIAAAEGVHEGLLPALATLQASFEAKAVELDGVVKVGRTHLMDAVPIRVGQELSAYARMVENARRRIASAGAAVLELPLGGTAVGTGLGAERDFAPRVITIVGRQTGLSLKQAPNLFEALATRDALVELSAAMRSWVVSFTKIANDIRWMSSGPRCGIGELRIPELQPGSSIMPGKVNPVIPEMSLMACAQVVGHDATIAWGGAAGNFELNTMIPVIGHAALQSIEILTNASRLFAERCIDGLAANEERCAELVEQSMSLVTALSRRIGYDAAAKLARESVASGKTVRALCYEKAILPRAELDDILDPRKMTE